MHTKTFEHFQDIYDHPLHHANGYIYIRNCYESLSNAETLSDGSFQKL